MTFHRPMPTCELGERPMLEGWLDFHRATLLHKCEGLDADRLRQRSAPPSGLSLLGLIRHLAEVERWWFRTVFAGQTDLGEIYGDEDHPEADFDDLDGADPDADLATLQSEIDLARAAAAGHGLDETGVHPARGAVSLRWIYVHMIEEYARHVGHADLLRERIDGVTGD